MIVLEPSCAAVFRDELVNLFPDNEDAKRLRQQTFVLSEFLIKKVPQYQWPTLKSHVLVHGHCHQKAIMKMTDEETALRKLGLDYTLLDSGCCGMAGSFGFEKDHYEVAMKCGERVLLPAVRKAAKDCLIIADGFSCREQIAQATDRRALHLAQVMQLAMHHADSFVDHSPEQTSMMIPVSAPTQSQRSKVAYAGLFLAGFVLLWRLWRHVH